MKRHFSHLAAVAVLLLFSASALAARKQPQPQLELLSWSWHRDGVHGDYVIVDGAVKNTTNKPLKDVEAVALFYDKNDEFLTSDKVLVEYQPILAGQTTPFEVITYWNPAMETAAMEFKRWGDGTIPCKGAGQKKARQPSK